MTRTTVVVGGGVAGLEVARQRAMAGEQVTVLEAGDRCGGALRSAELGGVSVDVGAEAFGVARPETRRLIDELGLAHLVIEPRRSDARLLLDDGLHAMPHALLGVPTDLMSPEVVSAIGEDAARAAAELDRAPLADLPADVTLGALVRARMGDRVVARILTPVVAGVHAADPDLVEAEAVVPGLLSALRQEGGLAAAAARLRAASGVPGAAVNGLRGGMTTLVRALEVQARGLGVTIRTDTSALAIERTSGDWRVVTPGGPLAADALVVAVDAPSAAGLLTSVPDVADPLSRIAVGDVVVCAAVLRAPELDEDPVGSGLLVQPGHPRVRAKALTHATAKWEWIRAAYGPGRHLVRLSYGRDGRVAEALTELPDIVRADLQTVFGLGEPVIEDFCIRRWNRSLVFPRPGHRAAVANLRAAVADLPTLDVVGAGLGGNGLAGTIGLSQGSR